jgi:glycosyltransferase involved in cell wall biosynthesis
MLYYRFLGKKIVFTAHNVNAGRRDSKDTVFNRLTIRIQYRLADRIFVHTEKMKLELIDEFAVEGVRVTVVPFGINNAVPKTSITPAEARKRLGIKESEKTILFFGNIAPYKGLEYLTSAFQKVATRHEDYRLVIAGRAKNCDSYWTAIQETIDQNVQNGRILLKADFIPDDETELYFKAADVLVLPYRHIYQSGVLFLGYSFGLPVLAADVGSLKAEIVEGKTGFVFRPEDPVDLANLIEHYFASDLYTELSRRRREILDFAMERYSWDVVGQKTMSVYADILDLPTAENLFNRDTSGTPLDMKIPS